MKDAILDIVLNKINNTLRKGALKPSTLKLFKQVPMLHEFVRHLKNIENEFTILKCQLLEGCFHVPEHELNRIGDVALEVEDIIDFYSYFLGQADDLSVSKQKNTVNELKNRIVRVPSICLRYPQYAQNEQLTPLETQQNIWLTEWLMDSTPGRTIISVWGTRSGTKTKLVNKVVENPEIKGNFHLYAYVSVSECHGNHQLLRKIAHELMEGVERIEDGDLISAIRGCLQNKRYLIILDDFKDREFWPILDSAFLVNELGNKVVITTHCNSVASLADANHIIKMHSFTDLPNDLQNCILYCGLFPRNYSIARKWITGLWIAEEFVVDVSYVDKTLEEVAEDYLRELIEYSQLRVVKKDIHGNIKQFMVHDYVDLSSCRVENFGVALRGSDTVEVGTNTCRVFIEKSNGPMQFGPTNTIRSFILFDDEAPPLWIVDTLSNFEFLQILCLRHTTIEEVPDAIYQLCRLRCLDLAFTMVEEIRSSVQRLHLLQTLDLRHTLVRLLPEEVKYLRKLQHLYAAHPSIGAITLEGDICNLIDLQTLRKITVNSNCVTNLKRLTKLRNLFIMEVKQKFVGKLLESLSSMPVLNKLGIVMCTGEILNMISIATLRNLEKLHLEGRLEESTVPAIFTQFGMLKEFRMVMSGLCSDPLPHLSKMSNLVNLEIKGAYDGKQLMFCADWFPNLKKLHLGNMPKICRVVIENGTMRNLQCLRFASLSSLKEVPNGLRYLEKLEDIILYMMPNEFLENAQVYVPRAQITKLPR